MGGVFSPLSAASSWSPPHQHGGGCCPASQDAVRQLLCSLRPHSVYAMYNTPTPAFPPANAISLTSVLSCNFTASAYYCQPPFFCENSAVNAMSCTFSGNVPAPPPSPPPPPSPTTPPGGWPTCHTSTNVSNAVVTGVYCSAQDCGDSCNLNPVRAIRHGCASVSICVCQDSHTNSGGCRARKA